MNRMLLRDKWVSESQNLMEKTKQDCKIQQYFTSELQILMHDKSMSNHERHRRFKHLIDDTSCCDDGSTVKGEIQGHRFLWCRASFANKSVQVNRSNKLRIEIFSKLSSPIEIAIVELHTNSKATD